MTLSVQSQVWAQFLEVAKKRTSTTAFMNWLSPIEVLEETQESISLLIPNIFVKEYILSNFKEDLLTFVPRDEDGEPNIRFIVQKQEKRTAPSVSPKIPSMPIMEDRVSLDFPEGKLNESYTFSTFIEGHANQFAKSAAFGVATSPGQSYNPLFIHGGVGLGKTHLLHSIGHHVRGTNKKLRVQCITTEEFINQLVDSLRNKTIEKLKKYYRCHVDVLLVDDIQFLQSPGRANFQEEFCNMFEALINQRKQIVITCDKPPSQLKLSERMIARMEWGLVTQVGTPDLETRVAILQHKAELKGVNIPSNIAFFIAENIQNNIRQLEGAINRLGAYAQLMNTAISEQFVEKILRDMFQLPNRENVTIESILKSVACIFQVKMSDLKSETRTKNIALPRQVAMFLAKEMIRESLTVIGEYFHKTHSTILHACKNIEKKTQEDDILKRQIEMVRRNLETAYKY